LTFKSRPRMLTGVRLGCSTSLKSYAIPPVSTVNLALRMGPDENFEATRHYMRLVLVKGYERGAVIRETKSLTAQA
jgi:hypothetical protein